MACDPLLLLLEFLAEQTCDTLQVAYRQLNGLLLGAAQDSSPDERLSSFRVGDDYPSIAGHADDHTRVHLYM